VYGSFRQDDRNAPPDRITGEPPGATPGFTVQSDDGIEHDDIWRLSLGRVVCEQW